MIISTQIKKDLKRTIEKSLGFKLKKIHLEHPENSEHGDYTSNFALENFGEIKIKGIKNPLDLAQKIVDHFPNKKYLQKIKAVPPGFINFYLSDKFLVSQINQIIKEKDGFGTSNLGKNTKVMVEFGQPNTHKLPHVGHFRSYVLGETIARILEFTGFEVCRVNYQGDVGLHVAKCLWGYKRKNIKESKDLTENIKNLQKAYIYGSKVYEENEKDRKEIDELNTKIYSQDKSVVDLWKKTRQWSLNYYALIHKRLGIVYRREYFESETARAGKKIVLENVNKIFKKSKGAIIFPGEKYGLHNRVFITAAGNPTYEAKDLALIFLKKTDFDYDFSLISTASEQIEYFKVVYNAAERIAPDLAKKFIHIPFGLVSLTEIRLSSRKGTIISIDELLEKTKESLIALMQRKNYNEEQIENIVETLTISATKYSILKQMPIKNIAFNIKESIALEGNSGPYLQYTYARACSILKKVKETFQDSDPLILREKEELQILKLLYCFPEIIEKAVQNYTPNLICNYLFKLAQNFNNFYETLPVLKVKDKNLKRARVVLIKTTAQVLKNGLKVLGIPALEKM